MEFIDFSEFGDAVVAIVPSVALDVSLNQANTVAEILNWAETLKENFFNIKLGLKIIHE